MRGYQFMVVRPEMAVEVQNLVKRYPKMPFNSVDNISFSIRRGEIFGLLGPNGAGKTTTISILTTRMLPTSGTTKIMGYDTRSQPIQAKKHLAVVPQKSNLDQSLRVRDILIYHAAYHGIGRVEREKLADKRLEEFGLSERKYDKVGYYSGGMGQRLMIARALMHKPDVLFLDEPTNRLDPQSRLFLWERIQKLKEQGVTILLTTHDMDEAELLCDRIAIMDHGHILVLDTASELKKVIPGGSTLEMQVRFPGTNLRSKEQFSKRETQSHSAISRVRLVPLGQSEWLHSGWYDEMARAQNEAEQASVLASSRIQEALRVLPGVSKVSDKCGWPGGKGKQDSTTFTLYAEDAASLISRAVDILHRESAIIDDLHLSRPTLEDVFIYLTGRKIRT